MLINRNTAPIVRNAQAVAFFQAHFDTVCMACDSLVHRVVENLGCKVVQRSVICAADIHAGPAADGLKAFKDLNGGGVVVAAGLGRIFEKIFRHKVNIGAASRPSQAVADPFCADIAVIFQPQFTL